MHKLYLSQSVPRDKLEFPAVSDQKWILLGHTFLHLPEKMQFSDNVQDVNIESLSKIPVQCLGKVGNPNLLIWMILILS
jgi:hypothetical protein